MKLTDLIIDPRTLGDRLWLVDVTPAYQYITGKRTDTITGYRYTVALPDHGLDKIAIRIDGPQQMSAPDGYIGVVCEGLELYLYWAQGDYHIGARATGIRPVSKPKT